MDGIRAMHKAKTAWMVAVLLALTAALGVFLWFRMQVVYGIRELKHPSDRVKEIGMKRLGRMGPRAETAVRELVETGDTESTWRAALLLGEIGGPDSLPALWKRLELFEPNTRQEIVDGIRGVAARLDASARAEAAHALVTRMGNHTDVDVKILGALGKIGSADEAPIVVLNFGASDDETRATAFHAAYEMAGRGVRVDVAARVEKAGLQEKAALSKILCVQGDERGVDLAAEVLKAGDVGNANQCEAVHLAALTFDQYTDKIMSYRVDEPADAQRAKIGEYLKFYDQARKEHSPLLAPKWRKKQA